MWAVEGTRSKSGSSCGLLVAQSLSKPYVHGDAGGINASLNLLSLDCLVVCWFLALMSKAQGYHTYLTSTVSEIMLERSDFFF